MFENGSEEKCRGYTMQELNDIIIRRATTDETDIIAEFNQEMAMETENKILPTQIISKGVKNLFARPQSGFYLVCEFQKKIIGSCMITFEWSDWRNGYFWWIQSLYIKPDFRRKGIFRRMYFFIKKQARQAKDVCGIRLYVDKNNTIAKRTYCNLGMSETDYRLYEEEFFG